MLHSVFYFVLNMSIIAAMITIVLFAVRAVFGRWLPRPFIYYMWGIILFRLLIPVSLPSELSLINFLSSYITINVNVPKAYEGMPDLSMLNSIQAASQYFPIEYKHRSMEYIFKVSGAVWIFGAFFLIIYSVIVYSLTAARLNKGASVKNDDVLERLKVRLNINKDVHVYESVFVKSPVVDGIMNPKIIIPKDISEEVLEYALLHELCHIKHCDNLWRLISVFAACIHWFNPFAWMLLYISGQDMELACDEWVMKGLTGDERKSYANALLTLAVRQQGFLTAFGSTAVKTRVMNIASYKELSLLMAAISGVVCITIVVILVTNPVL